MLDSGLYKKVEFIMGLQIGVVTEKKKNLHQILTILNQVYDENNDNIEPISVIHLKSSNLVNDFVKFEFPDYLIVCLDSEDSKIIEILGKINQDPWLHSTGIIIIHSDEHKNFRVPYENLAILSYLSINEIKYQLSKILNIVMINRSVFLKKNVVENLMMHKSGDFVLDNDPSVVTSYVNLITTSLLNEKDITPNTEDSVRITLTELLMNAIEHGNCGISFEEKSSFLESGGNINELIKYKSNLPDNVNKKIFFSYRYTDSSISFTIRDCGNGFDHRKLKYNPESEDDLNRLHGRGIFLSRHFSKSIEYNDKGNEVTVTFMKETVSDKKPLGFSLLKPKHYNPGDIIFKQNDRSNSLFYIQRGIYTVEVNNQTVAELDSSDIFLGEMSFLLNNKRVATIKAKTQGTLIEIPKRVYIEIIKKYPNYGLFLSRLLAKRLDKMNELKTS